MTSSAVGISAVMVRESTGKCGPFSKRSQSQDLIVQTMLNVLSYTTLAVSDNCNNITHWEPLLLSPMTLSAQPG